MLKEFYKDKKVLVTGHTGFKGSWLCQVLLNFGAEIIGYSLYLPTKPALFEVLGLENKVNHNIADIADFKKLERVFKETKPEIVFHLAAQPLVRESYNEPLYTFETNIMGTANVLEAAKSTGIPRAVVIITTDKVYENKEQGSIFKETDRLGGWDPYSASKVGAEVVADSYIKSFFNPNNAQENLQTLVASTRAGNIIGGGDWGSERLMTDITRAVFERKETPTLRSPDSTRPWQFVLEPLLGYLMLGIKLYNKEKEFSGAWNFGPDIENCIKVKELTDKVLKIMGKQGYEVKENDYHKHEAGLLRLDNQKAKSILKWQPIFNIDQALEMTLEWYKRFYDNQDMTDFTNEQIKSFFNLLGNI